MNLKLKGRIVEKFGSQFEFALVIRNHESLVSKVVRGRRVLDVMDRRRWAKALDCEPSEIFPESKV